jgi:serine/threonine protein kinase
MKIIRKAEVSRSDKPRQVLSERQILASMNHQFIVRMYMAFQVRIQHCISSSFYENLLDRFVLLSHLSYST